MKQLKTFDVRYALVESLDVHGRCWRLIGDLNDHMCKHRLSHNILGNAKILWVVSENPHENCIQNEKRIIRPPVYETLEAGSY